MKNSHLYQDHLNRVSRSFAFCITQLEGDMRHYVGLSYLLCRILDTVEDSNWNDPLSQSQAYESFYQFLHFPCTEQDVKNWAQSFPLDTCKAELDLLQDSWLFFQDFQSLPPELNQKIGRSIVNMYQGMRFCLRTRKSGKSFRLQSLAEVNQYCFFVAGVVGDLLTECFQASRNISFSPQQVVDAHHFGLFLQKVNLLKDQKKDEKEGRFLVIPNRKTLLESLVPNAEGAIRYLTKIPASEKGFRLFCAWSLFLGLSSLQWFDKSADLFPKLPRFLTDRLLASVENIIGDNQALIELFQKQTARLGPAIVAPLLPGKLSAVFDTYSGPMTQTNFLELGMA